MSTQTIQTPEASATQRWLKSYYFIRATFSVIWVASAFTVGSTPPIAAALLIVYPAWDAIVNFADASRSGGIGRNKSQMLNFIVSAATAIAVIFAIGKSMNTVVAVFGLWAVLSGVFQLVTALRRWKSYGAQWAMILSGAQSALAGAFFVKMAGGTAPLGITTVAPYAAFGAFYFLVSAIWLTVSDARRRSSRVAT